MLLLRKIWNLQYYLLKYCYVLVTVMMPCSSAASYSYVVDVGKSLYLYIIFSFKPSHVRLGIPYYNHLN